MAQPPQRKIIHLPKIRMLGRPGRPSSGIRITNIQSIKPPDPELVKKNEEERLRAQLHKEIELRSKTCANKSYTCMFPVLSGRDYCVEHILQDRTAPYKQCSYTLNNGQRCHEPAPNNQNSERKDQGLCFEHARAALASKQKSSAPPPPVTTTETILNQLQHYISSSRRRRTSSCASSVSVVSEGEDIPLGPPPDPFRDIDANQVTSTLRSSRIDCSSPVDSDAESVTLGRDGDCRGGHDEDLSGEEEPSYDLYPLRHAGIFTAEEAVSEALNALRLLRCAYVKQMGRLKTLLQSARHTYLSSLKAEREQYASINTQARSGPLTVKERKQLRKLKAYASFHKKHGVDAVLARKLQRKRAKVNDLTNRGIPSAAKCVYTDEGVRCGLAVLPASRHCLKHCIYDRNQVLFFPCGDVHGGVPCREPVPRLPLSHACLYHTRPHPHTTYNIKKDDSETDSEATNTAVSDCSQSESEYPTASDDRMDTSHIPVNNIGNNHIGEPDSCTVESVEYGGKV